MVKNTSSSLEKNSDLTRELVEQTMLFLRSTSPYSFVTSHIQSGVGSGTRWDMECGTRVCHRTLGKCPAKLSLGLSVRQHFGGLRHHKFWLQRQNMDVCPVHSRTWTRVPYTAPGGAVRPLTMDIISTALRFCSCSMSVVSPEEFRR